MERRRLRALVDANLAAAGELHADTSIHDYIVFGGEESGPARYSHTDFYEKQDGQWRVVWSQATPAATEAAGTI